MISQKPILACIQCLPQNDVVTCAESGTAQTNVCDSEGWGASCTACSIILLFFLQIKFVAEASVGTKFVESCGGEEYGAIAFQGIAPNAATELKGIKVIQNRKVIIGHMHLSMNAGTLNELL